VAAESPGTRAYEFGPFRLDPAERRLLRNDAPIALTPKAFDLLVVLVENAGRLLEKDELMKRVWADAFVEEANLANNISLLRKTLGNGVDGLAYIETVPRRGYRFLGVVTDANTSSRHQAVDEPSIAAVAASQPVATAGSPGFLRMALTAPVRFGLLLALLLGAVAVVVTTRRSDDATTNPHRMRFAVVPPLGTSLPPPGQSVSPALSPDGIRMVFRVFRDGVPVLAIRILDELNAHVVANTEAASFPFWSPDGRTVGFFADGQLKRLDVSGGPVQTISEAADGYGGTWNRDDVILFAPRANDGLFSVPAVGGEPTQVTWLQTDETFHQHPQFLPDGRRFIYFASPDRIYLGSLDGDAPVRILTSRSQARYSPPGYLLFVLDRSLVAQRFDAERARVIGDPLPIGDDVPVGGAIVGGRPAGGGAFSVSENGVVVYRSVARIQEKLAWFDRSGQLLDRIAMPVDRFTDPELSPDGKQIAIASGTRPFADDIGVFDAATGRLTQLTFHPAQDRRPVWSPDGLSVAFASLRSEAPGIYQKVVTGERPEELLLRSDTSPPRGWPADWGPSGLVYADSRGGLSLLPPRANDNSRSLVPVGWHDAKVTSDGRWLAYTKADNPSGRRDVYVQSTSDPGGQWTISQAGGSFPRWRPDGSELFYLAANGSIMAVRTDTKTTIFRSGVPERLFDTKLQTLREGRQSFGVTPDGQRFLISVPDDASPTQSLVVVSNWLSTLKP
jgi:DNA-binding winged helix-turn-helix (wHTH) protein/Tol biopolymer transport system component